MKRALVLRAREDALRTSEKLNALGYDVVVSPVLEIAATGAAIPPGDYDAMLASSAKGVELATESPVYNRLTLHAVGAKTAAAARARGWDPQIIAGNAEAILPLLHARYPLPAHFLYLAGRERQPMLEAGLRSAGHRISAIEVYEARAATALTPEAVSAIATGGIDVALHYSRRSAAIFLNLARTAGVLENLRDVTHLALSADVAAPFLALGFEPLVAAKPDEAGILALLPELSVSGAINENKTTGKHRGTT